MKRFKRSMLVTVALLNGVSQVEAGGWCRIFHHRARPCVPGSNQVSPGLDVHPKSDGIRDVDQAKGFYVVFLITEAGHRVYDGEFGDFGPALRRYQSFNPEVQPAELWWYPE
ncbi:hypothetical protein [Paludisphaera soli]|uniref:hypothetical protein n=1 Tax=Paludisphaera soli TaxID=2712865 RepID=UPI0013EB8DEB|nr:hypothetical protein [Paludisphaera soli]